MKEGRHNIPGLETRVLIPFFAFVGTVVVAVHCCSVHCHSVHGCPSPFRRCCCHCGVGRGGSVVIGGGGGGVTRGGGDWWWCGGGRLAALSWFK